jgi:hypothetical protein
VWDATLRIKHQLHNRGDHYEVELQALPKANGVVIRYTTDGSSPTTMGFATYDGPIRVAPSCRVIRAMAVAPLFAMNSDAITVTIPQRGQDDRVVDPAIPARWNQQTRLDDAGLVWDFIQRLEESGGVTAYDVGLTAESTDREQNVEYSGAVEGGYNAALLKVVAQKLQEIVGGGDLRMTVGSLGFPTGQALLDWLKATRQPFNLAKVSQ